MEWPISWEDVKNRLEALENSSGGGMRLVKIETVPTEESGSNGLSQFAYLSDIESSELTAAVAEGMPFAIQYSSMGSIITGVYMMSVSNGSELLINTLTIGPGSTTTVQFIRQGNSTWSMRIDTVIASST